jgi:dTDP-4-amino-4,6-dideoxygalactose transaminase
MEVPFLDIKASYLELKDEFDAAYHRVMDSGWVLLGQETEAFEKEFAAYCETQHCISVGNGLDALQIILRALGIGDGDEVIVPSHTFIATWLAVSYCGARPVPVEPDLKTFNIDQGKIANAITSNTKAIIPVHLYGQPADMEPIMNLANVHGLKVIEDNAQAQGARYHGRRTGGLGHAAGTSFYPGKNLGAFGDAGAITTNDGELADRCRMIRNYGARVKYQHVTPGLNSRMDELQAAFLRIKLKKLDEWNGRRLRLAEHYLHSLSGSVCEFPHTPDWARSVWHLFTILMPNRNAVQNSLANELVQTGIHYPIPAHLSGAYSNLGYRRGSFPIAEKISEQTLSLPIYPQLSLEQATCVVEAIKKSIT